MGNEENERTQAASTAPRRPSLSDQPYHRLLPSIRRTVGGTGSTPSPAGEYPTLGRRPPPVPERTCANGIFYVLRTGCQWKSLDATGICSGSTADLRFQEWAAAAAFLELWRTGLERCDELKGLDWSWLSMGGALTKSPFGRGKNRPQPHGSG